MKKRKKISFKKILSHQKPKKKKPTSKEKERQKEVKITQTKPLQRKEFKEKQKQLEGKATKQRNEKKTEYITEASQQKTQEPKEFKSKIPQKKNKQKKDEIMIVRVEEEFYGIPLSSVEEIKREIKLTRTPQLSEFLSGIAEIRETIVPVVDFAHLFGIKKEAPVEKKTPVIVVEISNQLVGFEVSQIAEIVEIHKEEILPLPDIFPPQLFSGGYTYKSFVVGIINVECLLKGKQIQSFKEKIDEVIK